MASMDSVIKSCGYKQTEIDVSKGIGESSGVDSSKATQVFAAVKAEAEREAVRPEIETKLAASSDSVCELRNKIKALADTLCVFSYPLSGPSRIIMRWAITKEEALLRMQRMHGTRCKMTEGRDYIYRHMDGSGYRPLGNDPKASEFYELCNQELLLFFNKEAAKKELETHTLFWPDFDTRDQALLEKNDIGSYWLKKGSKENTYEFCIIREKSFIQSYELELTDKGIKFEDKYFLNIYHVLNYGTKDVKLPYPLFRGLFKNMRID
jgi:hypothetical protein